MSRHAIQMYVAVAVEVTDRDVIDRVVNNTPDEPGGKPWREVYYDLRTEADVIEHLAYNCVNNGIEHANRLDGWADLAPEAATMRITDVESA